MHRVIIYRIFRPKYGWEMSQKLPVNGLEGVKQKELSKINEDFIKNLVENSNNGYFLEVDIDYPK